MTNYDPSQNPQPKHVQQPRRRGGGTTPPPSQDVNAGGNASASNAPSEQAAPQYNETTSYVPPAPEPWEAAPPTQEWPPVDPGLQGYAGQPMPAQASPGMKPGALIAIIAAVVLLLGGGVFAAMKVMGGSDGDVAADSEDSLTVTETVSEAPLEDIPNYSRPTLGLTSTMSVTSTTHTTSTTTMTPTESKRSFSNFQAQGPTSQQFAANVYSEFVDSYNGNANITLRSVYSPVTGRSYTMSCQDRGSFVTCTGGNDAMVKIW